MTFQEAQARFSSIVNGVSPAMSSADLVQKQKDLQSLLSDLPNTAEFDPIAEAISEFSPKLKGKVTQAVAKDLRSRDAIFSEASTLFAVTSEKAEADARTLTFAEPKLIATALVESVTTLQQIRDAANEGNLVEAALKADALALMLLQVQQSIRAG